MVGDAAAMNERNGTAVTGGAQGRQKSARELSYEKLFLLIFSLEDGAHNLLIVKDSEKGVMLGALGTSKVHWFQAP